jgi:hypothetical protein
MAAIPEQREFVVIIGDISGSKQMNGSDRYQTQLFMKSAIVQLNEEYQAVMEAPATITKGDEFQALIENPVNAYKIVRTMQKMVFPTVYRFGIGVGSIYRMGGILPIEMDGPAFHRANHALVQAKKNKSSIWFISENTPIDTLINTILLLISAIKSRWNERHFLVYWDYLAEGTYRRVAEKRNITPQAIGDVLKNMRATEVIEAEKNLEAVLSQFQSKLAEQI